jgi:hypothetical protein
MRNYAVFRQKDEHINGLNDECQKRREWSKTKLKPGRKTKKIKMKKKVRSTQEMVSFVQRKSTFPCGKQPGALEIIPRRENGGIKKIARRNSC